MTELNNLEEHIFEDPNDPDAGKIAFLFDPKHDVELTTAYVVIINKLTSLYSKLFPADVEHFEKLLIEEILPNPSVDVNARWSNIEKTPFFFDAMKGASREVIKALLDHPQLDVAALQFSGPRHNVLTYVADNIQWRDVRNSTNHILNQTEPCSDYDTLEALELLVNDPRIDARHKAFFPNKPIAYKSALLLLQGRSVDYAGHLEIYRETLQTLLEARATILINHHSAHILTALESACHEVTASPKKFGNMGKLSHASLEVDLWLVILDRFNDALIQETRNYMPIHGRVFDAELFNPDLASQNEINYTSAVMAQAIWIQSAPEILQRADVGKNTAKLVVGYGAKQIRKALNLGD